MLLYVAILFLWLFQHRVANSIFVSMQFLVAAFVRVRTVFFLTTSSQLEFDHCYNSIKCGILCRWVTQKHCVTPEKVPLPSSADSRLGFQQHHQQQHLSSFQNCSAAAAGNDYYQQQQQYRANSSAHSIAFYDSDIVNSLERIFNITGWSLPKNMNLFYPI